MKRVLIFIISIIMVISACGCNNQTPGRQSEPDADTATVTETSGTTGAAGTTETAETTDAAESESFSEPDVTPVTAEREKGCWYGENTGTAATFTGLEPLPLNGFEGVSFDNTKGLSDNTIEHSYGVATEEQPHTISVNNQRFFDEKGFAAVCYDARATEKYVYLTFDCGYENGYTAKILDTLRDKGVKAAFFCTLPEMKENTDIIARMINEGHIVGNHSVTHPDFSKLTRKEMYDEVITFDDYLREHFGYSAQYFRYPQGKYSENSLDLLNQMGYTCVFWSLAYADWDLKNQKGADYALETVISRIHPGAVILLHAVSPDNANALGNIIDAARAKGYGFRSLSEYVPA